MRRQKTSSWLFIDTSVSGVIRAGLISRDNSKIKKRAGRSGALLKLISEYFGCSLKDIQLTGVCVVAGPGSFSAVRQGVLTANILARVYGLPLVGITVNQAASIENLADDLFGGKLEASDYVAPVYDAEPNITMKKKLEVGS